MTDPDRRARLRDLEARIDALKAPREVKPHTDEHYSQAQHAWRMVIELVSGLLIGFGIGYGLDSLLGTLPIFLVIFTLLGLAAGIKVMIRSAQEIQSKQQADQAKTQMAETGQDERAKDGD
ncbi:AtpZ/AtpI family protein [Roseovarius nanhaiticus]|uniref:ATP synthase protein I n=1 Tax=Roseovarius nanhaiticus TaxID=573024 RepID=A0A1N7F027_9RHOB|nr:AtpZ/AtpI family protein [Roseovarius nanhaiticus]SEK63745.1 ATP synthase protein I [Roseovarius nanhaiticus]SIR93667.1 ATP synthase protein I [Roseovarius nanhaiticus]